MKKLKLSLLIALFPLMGFSQNCNCLNNFKWAKETIENNDAGFQYVIDTKGESAYEIHNDIFEEKVNSIIDSKECEKVLQEWLTFFRSGHISIKTINTKQSSGSNNKSGKAQIIEKHKDWDKITIGDEEFNNYLNSKLNPGFEGVWESGSIKIGIKKIKDVYKGFIVKGDGVYWTKGQVKLIIEKDLCKYYLSNRSVKKFKNFSLVGNNYLEIGYMTFKRVSPEFESDPKVKKYIKSLKSNYTYFEKIDENTVLLRIPRFWGSDAKTNIDSVVFANKELILKTPTLIIDIRNNGGGSDRCYREIVPFLYTNPIRTIGVEYLSSPLNNQRMLDFINDPKYGLDDEEKEKAKESYDKLSKHIGEFFNIESDIVDILSFDTIYPYPQNVGILINANNGSTAEQFLIAAKQSKKVKLFGTTTEGVLDISNMYFVSSPDEKFELGYSLTRSMRMPEFIIDDRGVQPDYYMDKSIPKHKWIEFAANTLNK